MVSRNESFIISKAFGSLVRDLRQQSGLSLRTFCTNSGFDPGNISKLERGILQAPDNHEKRERLANALGIKPNSKDWVNFMDLAAASQIESRLDGGLEAELVKRLPVFFRALKRNKVTPEQLDELIEQIKKA